MTVTHNRRIQLRGLDYRSFTHPYDASARQRMEAVPLVGQLASFLHGAINEKIALREGLGGQLRVGPRQYPSLYRRFVELAGVIDVPRLPHLFILASPELNATAQGMKEHFVTIHSIALDVLSEGELDFIIAHELGHIKCEHMKWKSVASILTDLGVGGLGVLASQVGGVLGTMFAAGAAVGFYAAVLAIMEWSRKAEFSADRAGLLGCQDPGAAETALAKLVSPTLRYQESVHIQELVAQAGELSELDQSSFVARLMKVRNYLTQTHPYTPLRIQSLAAWQSEGEYRRILTGDRQIPAWAQALPPAPPPPPPASPDIGLRP